MNRREPPLSLPGLPGPARHEPDEAPPRLRSLRGNSRRRPTLLSRLGSLALYLGLLAACVMAGAATFLLVAAPTDLVRDQVVAQVKARTGRTLQLAGPASFTLFPAVGVRLADVTLSAPPGMQAAPLLKVARLDIDLQLLPLLQREIVVERLVLTRPVLELSVDRQGRTSWEQASAGDGLPAAAVRVAQAQARGGRSDGLPPELESFVRNASDPARAAERDAGALAGLDDLRLADVRIEDGIVRYHDERNGQRQEVRALHAELALKALNAPLEAKGRLEWKGEAVRFDARLGTPRALMDGRPAKLVAKLGSGQLEASYDGTLAQRSGMVLDGKLSAASPSVRGLARWLGAEPAPSAGLGAASVAGILKAGGTAASLDAAVLMLDGATANGTLSVEAAGARPLIRANLRISELDLDRYRATGPAPAPSGGRSEPRLQPAAAAPSPGRPAAARPAQSIEELIERDDAAGTRVRGFSQRQGWSSEPLDLSALTVADADARLSFGRILGGGLRFGTTQMLVALKAGQLRLTIDDAQLYEGRAKGLVTVDASKGPVVGANLQVEGVAAEPLLKDAAGFDSLAGKARMSLALGGQGRSEREIVETLSGRIDLSFADGAIVGWNIPQMIRGLSQGRFSGFEKLGSEKTDFSELAASFQVAGGVATNKDLRLNSPLLRITGAGTVEVPARRLDFLVRPKLVASLTGQGGGQDLAGFEIPIKVHGPWDRPSYAPDVQGMLRDPSQVIDAVKRLDSQGRITDAVRRALGAGEAGREAPGQAPAEPQGQGGKTRQLLEQFLKR